MQQSWQKQNDIHLTNVFEFFNCQHFYIDSGDYIHYVKSTKINFDKIIVLSATPNEFYYSRIFKNKLTFYNIGAIEPKGIVKQDIHISFSRSKFKKEPSYIKLIQKLFNKTNLITFKSFKSDFPNCVGHFGGISGMDQLKGKDLIICGTPHFNENMYYLDAAILGVKCSPNEELMSYHPVEYQGRRFYFNSYTHNDDLQYIQISSIEAELLQALGRARHLRENCEVIVLSNLPIIGAQYIDLELYHPTNK